jgi:spore coat protein A
MRRIQSLLSVVAVAFAATAAAGPAVPGGTLSPSNVPKFTDPLAVPPRLTPGSLTTTTTDPVTGLPVTTVVSGNHYDLAVRPVVQQVLPTRNNAGKPLKTPYPATPVWGYGAVGTSTFSWPAFTIEAQQGVPTTVTWRNQLVDAAGNFVPHLLTVDPTLHWANPPGPTDTRPTFTGAPPAPYTGPVPLSTHLHGAHIEPQSDGFPEAWFLPAAANVTPCITPGNPAGCFFSTGSNFMTSPRLPAPPPGATNAYYQNDQRAATLWYHDHTLGMTRANVYAGLAGFYLLRDSYETAAPPFGLGLTTDYPYGTYEIPLAIQDRSFNADGTLFYPTTRAFFDGFAGPYIPDPMSDISPYWNPEFFGNFMVVNGKTWPKHSVEARKYRFRVLNGSDSRWLILSFADVNLVPLAIPFHVIGNDSGFLTGAPVATTQLVVAPGERYDVIVDFAAVAPGTRVIMTNLGPDAPYGGVPPTGAARANAGTTGQVMAFDVVAATTPNPALPASLAPPPEAYMPAPIEQLQPAAGQPARTVTLTEFMSMINPAGPAMAQVGDAWGPHPWHHTGTENVALNAVEVWQIVNRTVDAHPIHLHQVGFQVLDRTPIDLIGYDAALAACKANPAGAGCPVDPALFAIGPAQPPAPYELGQKDTVMAKPGEMTRLKAYFDIPGQYVWHCHILSHEDNEMMRPLCVGDVAGCPKSAPMAPMAGM